MSIKKRSRINRESSRSSLIFLKRFKLQISQAMKIGIYAYLSSNFTQYKGLSLWKSQIFQTQEQINCYHLYRMNESFEIPVSYKGETFSFHAKLLPYGYTHRIIVSVDYGDVVFEPDEERNYRALIDPLETNIPKRELDVGLLRAIAETIESIVK